MPTSISIPLAAANTTKGYLINNLPANYEVIRTLDNVLNNFVEIGNFVSGYSSMRITVSLGASGVSEVANYNISSTFAPTPTSWFRVLPRNHQSYTSIFAHALDIKIDGITTYLRIRRIAGSVAAEARIRIEYIGNTGGTFTETFATGSEANALNEYRYGLNTVNGINYIPNLQITDSVPWILATLQNSWTSFGVGNPAASYRKLPDGTIEFKGLIKKATTPGASETLFTLPVGYRISESRVFGVISNGALGRVDMSSNGGVALTTGSNIWLSLEGIRFVAEQ